MPYGAIYFYQNNFCRYDELTKRYESLLQAFNERCNAVNTRDNALNDLQKRLNTCHNEINEVHKTLITVCDKYLALKYKKNVQVSFIYQHLKVCYYHCMD